MTNTADYKDYLKEKKLSIPLSYTRNEYTDLILPSLQKFQSKKQSVDPYANLAAAK